METIEQYFERPDTPMPKSPTGLAMVELVKLCPTITFEDARAAVNDIGASLAKSPKECAISALRAIQSQSTAKVAA